MGPFAFANHLVNLIVPALALAAVAAALAKWAWRAELAASSWWRLAVAAASVNVVVTLVGLAWTGRDGKMATYAAMALATAATLWWLGFGRGRR